MKSKYMLMKESTVTDGFGNNYPDLATFKINDFVPKARGIDYQLSEYDCLRFFTLSYQFYSDYNFYDDITLWFNDILWISDIRHTSDRDYQLDMGGNFERYLKFYNKQDIDSWLLDSF
jgi:hypothetical protein